METFEILIDDLLFVYGELYDYHSQAEARASIHKAIHQLVTVHVLCRICIPHDTF